MPPLYGIASDSDCAEDCRLNPSCPCFPCEGSKQCVPVLLNELVDARDVQLLVFCTVPLPCVQRRTKGLRSER